MKAMWTLQDGWLLLQKRIDDGTTYALFVQCLIPDNNVVDMTLQVILKTRPDYSLRNTANGTQDLNMQECGVI